ncbi:phosphate signaling complex protein PhoU [Acidithiobacillus thiooxidans]|jgi:phosphate transport system protein|uniref:Phosphate-specific transport system accessory protein PhoU n=2 Tax=Acidithiobacillus thiooxidans TaxID=930 RepID=A0A1C2J2H1_ACITH|nr:MULTISPECIES: phosphate signaling complex protein PhoU [Acidithiobacillus]MBE7565628.1 phosphate signaling complex protein PhoU [Acidithiobacillus sp. HP-11]MBU2740106.1 phosphate signaling complex protein PhoU [Acidithiobacillus albertensis]MBU2751279.1 phosphate signaling complex protein PhoU [Acidithiobacillus thiooxidans]MBU2792920.1 phosphate signaling complex protein PhoU [Acidithiobacillus thiooxidans]MBU2809926.1 phosphate signaling complex protein PhoU [Acidithiobacillus thiooxidan
MDKDQHISQRFNDDLNEVHELVLAMGGVVEEQISNAIRALQTGDNDLAREVVARDHEVNGYEVRIEEECINILAMRQPAASDLRLVMTLIKSIADLERMGDKASKIADMVLAMGHGTRNSNPAFLRDVGVMADYALNMLRRAMDALARADAEQAIAIAKGDEILNQEYRSALRRLITYMMEDPRTITPAIDALFIAKAIERIGDHARNICEYVIYLAKGKNVRHLPLDQVEQSLQGK